MQIAFSLKIKFLLTKQLFSNWWYYPLDYYITESIFPTICKLRGVWRTLWFFFISWCFHPGTGSANFPGGSTLENQYPKISRGLVFCENTSAKNRLKIWTQVKQSFDGCTLHSARIRKRSVSPGINSNESIPGLLKRVQIRALERQAGV